MKKTVWLAMVAMAAAMAVRDASAGWVMEAVQDRARRDLERDMRGESNDYPLIDLRYPHPYTSRADVAAHPERYYVPANPTDVMVMPQGDEWAGFVAMQASWYPEYYGGIPALDPTLPRYNPAVFGGW